MSADANDLSAKSGLTHELLLQLVETARQGFIDASFRLGERVTTGDASTVEAVRDLGLSLADLRAFNPDRQMHTVLGALGKVTDEWEMDRLGIALFGKAWAVAGAIA
jgi:hypothetical protein